jgi:hypothetical protein
MLVEGSFDEVDVKELLLSGWSERGQWLIFVVA